MARLILSDIIEDIRGTVGTHVYSYWKGIHLVKIRSVNYRTAHESAFRQKYHNFIARLSQYWAGGLTQDQRDGWESYAEAIALLGPPYYGPSVIKLNGWKQYGGIMSGANAFVLTNQLRRSIGKTDILEDDPEAIDPPAAPIWSTLEYFAGPPKKLRVTIIPPGSFPEDAWLRCFCRGVRYAHLILAKVSDGAMPVIEAWDVHYDGTSLPPASAPVWTLVGTEYGAVAGGILTCTIPGSGASHGYYRDVGWGVNWTAEIRLKYIAGVDKYKFRVDTTMMGPNGCFAIIYIKPDRITVWWGAGLNQDYMMDTTDGFHEYRIKALGAALWIYVDKVLLDTKVMIPWGASAIDRITFASVTTSEPLVVDIDWVKYEIAQGFTPTPSAQEWEDMRYAKGFELPIENDIYQVQLDYISQNGRYSAPSTIQTVQALDAFPGGLWGSYVWNNYLWG